MSGKPWTDERKAAHAASMTARWRDPAYRAKQQSRPVASPEARAAAGERMKQLNEQMRTDTKLKAKCVRGMTRTRRRPEYRAMQSLVMAETMARPENRAKARQHACEINRDPETRARQWAGKIRNGATPRPPRAKRAKKLTGEALFLHLLALEAKGKTGRRPSNG